MTKILKRISEYTLDEFKQYCANNGIEYEFFKYYFRNWAIFHHEDELMEFITKVGRDKVVTVDGCICINKEHHKVKPKTLPLLQAFDKMITTDVQDYGIMLSPGGTYYVLASHGRGHNVFKFKLDDDKN